MLPAFLLLICASPALAQTKLKLSTILPGSESVQLVANGDFQVQGTASPTNTHPAPSGWTRTGDMFADPGTNMVPADNGVVALATVTGSNSVCQYKRSVTLQPATDYVFSAYVWNFGNSANHVTAVIDLNDAPGEPQITLSYSDANADQGYFVYKGFNTTNTGTNVTVRLFYDSPVGTYTASKYYPVAAQWDNLAITPAASFVAPIIGTNSPPLVSILSPTNGASLVYTDSPLLQISASASDSNGSVTNVEFFAGATKVGESATSPYSCLWSNFSSGAYQLTAKATDNNGAAAVSAPVSITVSTPAPPAALHIVQSGANFSLYWPTSFTSMTLEFATNLSAPDWQLVTNPVTISGDQFVVTVPSAGIQRFFHLGYGVDPSTLYGKMLFGYQGWFACPGDGSPMNKWVHWFANQNPVATNLTVDFWPDLSEFDQDELYPTGLTMQDGSTAMVYSPWNQKTVMRHFKWMKDNNLDGVFLQRFTSELSSTSNLKWRNGMASNIWAGAEAYGRVFAIMYDISGQNESTLLSTLTNDWLTMLNTMHITNSPRYIRHKGKPVVTVWGFGFTSRTNTPDEAIAAINFFKATGCTVMGGVPTYWRTLTSDSRTDPAWATAYRSFDIISPWSVSRFSDTSGADTFKNNVIIPDLADCNSHGIDYMPVLFPGFSWYNLKDSTYPLNQIPRKGGTFYWRQAFNAVSAGCTMLYGAMYDEMNEGTSMFKMVADANQLPAQGSFVYLNIDPPWTNLPTDWYLRLADQASRMLRGDIPLTPFIPISP